MPSRSRIIQEGYVLPKASATAKRSAMLDWSPSRRPYEWIFSIKRERRGRGREDRMKPCISFSGERDYTSNAIRSTDDWFGHIFGRIISKMALSGEGFPECWKIYFLCILSPPRRILFFHCYFFFFRGSDNIFQLSYKNLVLRLIHWEDLNRPESIFIAETWLHSHRTPTSNCLAPLNFFCV